MKFDRPQIIAALLVAAILTAPLLIWLPTVPVLLLAVVLALRLLPLTQDEDKAQRARGVEVFLPPTDVDPELLRRDALDLELRRRATR